MLDLGKTHIDKRLIAWVGKDMAGIEAAPEDGITKMLVPPVPGQVPVFFTLNDLDDDMTLTIDSHSSSPIFVDEAKQTAILLAKMGAMGPQDLVHHFDAPDPEQLDAAIQRRQAAAAEAEDRKEKIKLITSGRKG